MGAAAGRAAAVTRFVGDDLEQPRPKGRLQPEARQRDVCLEQRILRDVFGFRRITSDHIRQVEGSRLVPLGQQAKRRGLARARTLQELEIVDDACITPRSAGWFPRR
jgi:hypothetical protein